jgi:hypothetical protein
MVYLERKKKKKRRGYYGEKKKVEFKIIPPQSTAVATRGLQIFKHLLQIVANQRCTETNFHKKCI